MKLFQSIPKGALQDLTREFYFIEISSKAHRKSIPVIDDCSYDLVFFKEAKAKLCHDKPEMHLDIPYHIFTIHQLRPPYRISFKGQLTFFTIKLQPWYNASFFSHLETSGIKDIATTFDDTGRFHEELFNCDDVEERFKLAAWLMHQLRPASSERIELVRSICLLIQDKKGMLSVQELSSHFSKSRQYLSSIFKREVLYSLKKYITTVRILSLINYKTRHPERSLTQLAYEFQYFDQAHFNHDFSNVCGVKPKEFFRDLPEFLLRH